MEDDMAADMEVYVVADMEVDKVAENMAVMTVDMFKTMCKSLNCSKTKCIN